MDLPVNQFSICAVIYIYIYLYIELYHWPALPVHRSQSLCQTRRTSMTLYLWLSRPREYGVWDFFSRGQMTFGHRVSWGSSSVVPIQDIQMIIIGNLRTTRLRPDLGIVTRHPRAHFLVAIRHTAWSVPPRTTPLKANSFQKGSVSSKLLIV